MENKNSINIKSKSKQIKRCQFKGCNCKIPVAFRTIYCTCGKTFCNKHRMKEDHNCKAYEIKLVPYECVKSEKISKI